MSSYTDAVSHLDALGIDAMKKTTPSLHRMEALCDLLNHPERTLQVIHVTGTNGKTSTAGIATALLTTAGLSVGTYTSPHLQTIRERLSRDGRPVGEAEFGDVFEHLLPYARTVEERLGERLTYFELLTAMFFLWAAEAPVDAVVVEVGLGGRWDATNVADGDVAVVTGIELDHTDLLGTSREVTAAEKAGIVKDGSRLVTAERDPAILAILKAEADRVGAPTLRLDRDFSVEENRLAVDGRYLSVRTTGARYEGLFVPLHGPHQGVNAAVALQAVTSFLPARELDEELVAQGMAGVKVAGRLESVPGGHGPAVFLDVAHNPSGASALVAALNEGLSFRNVVFVVGILAEKDRRGILLELTRLSPTFVFAAPRTERATDPSELASNARELEADHEVSGDVPGAVDRALSLASADDLVCITGSHYVVGEAREHLLPSGAAEEEVDRDGAF